jgi:hypothetical protein
MMKLETLAGENEMRDKYINLKVIDVKVERKFKK